MLRHSEIWRALDRLAAKHGLSASGLARRAGLDPTAFNKSKRKSPTGKPRWPSTESVAKCLTATGESLSGFLALIGERSGVALSRPLPMLGYSKAASSGAFDDAGHPAGKGWIESDPPGVSDPDAFALKITGNALAPVYRAGDVVVVSPDAQVRRGDRVIVKTRNGEIMAKELVRQSGQKIELKAIGSGPSRTLAKNDVLWIARVQWVRQ
jgi:phage repressor protein C with HTH and peptisase S24 domain